MAKTMGAVSIARTSRRPRVQSDTQPARNNPNASRAEVFAPIGVPKLTGFANRNATRWTGQTASRTDDGGHGGNAKPQKTQRLREPFRCLRETAYTPAKLASQTR